MELPLWLPAARSALHHTAIQRAQACGLVTRPLAETTHDTAAWLATLPGTEPVMPPPAPGGPARPQPGMAAEREAALLAAWRAR
jgi:hypothetical protein